jgi:PAS domain S-box-containing protein
VLALVLASLAAHYVFFRSSGSLALRRDEIPTLVAFLLSAAAADALSSLRRRAEDALRSAGKRLELAVRERTAELKRTNEELTAEIGERKRAEASLRASEEWWRTIFETSNTPMGVVELSGRHVVVNAATERVLGYTNEELRGISIRDLTYEDDRARTLPLFSQLASGERPSYLAEKRYRCKDGSIKWLKASVTRVRDPQGGPDLAASVVEDITERKRAEEALRASEERWRCVFESSAIPMALADGDRRIVAVNPACRRLLGYTQEEFMTMSALDFKYGGDRDVSAQMLSELEQGLRSAFQGEMRFRRKDGTPLWVNVSVSYVPASDTTPALFPAVIEDVTQRKQAELDRQRLASIVEQARDFMGIADLELTPIYLNEAGRKLVGLDMDEFRGRRGTHYLFREDRPFMRDVAWPSILKDGSWAGELRFRHFKTGEAIPILYNAFRIDDPKTGQPTNIGFVCRDITEGKKAEAALRASEERWRTVFEAASVGIATSDADRGILSANTALQRMLGYTEAELQELGWAQLTHEDDEGLTNAWVAHLSEGREKAYQVEKRYRRKDGQLVWVSVNASYVPATVATSAFFVSIIVDITDRRRAEDALRQAQAELGRVARVTAIGELGASIAHEINQPLAAIVASSSACRRWMESGQNLARAKESLNRVISDANRASDIIARIRTLTRGKAPERLDLNINDVVDEVLTFTRDELQSKDISILRDLRPDVPLVMGDRVQLQQVVLNLVMNGIEAMASSDQRRRVLTVKSQRDEHGAVLVTVEDTGTGLVPLGAERIFDAFFTTKPEGMGMGLAISTSIVEAHGGRLWASPVVPHGAAFHFNLPSVETNAS